MKPTWERCIASVQRAAASQRNLARLCERQHAEVGDPLCAALAREHHDEADALDAVEQALLRARNGGQAA